MRQTSSSWRLPSAGKSLSTDTDYLIYAEVHSLPSGPVLAIKSAVPVTGLQYFATLTGSLPKNCSFNVPSAPHGGFFSGEIFAVEGSSIYVMDMDPSPAPSYAEHGGGSVVGVENVTPVDHSPSRAEPPVIVPEVASVKLPPVSMAASSSITSDGGSHGGKEPKALTTPQNLPKEASAEAQSSKVPASPAVVAAAKPLPPDDFLEALESEQKSHSTPKVASAPKAQQPSPPGAGDGAFEPVKGTSLSVRAVGEKEFPREGPLPSLDEIDREVLAKKADARKKSTVNPLKNLTGAPKVTSGGLKLGETKGGDKTTVVRDNNIDEECLF